MDDVCKEKHKRINEILDEHGVDIDDVKIRLDVAEKNILTQQKDTTHLQDAIKALNKSIERLINELATLKLKPLAKYEAVAMIVLSAIIGIVIGRAF